MSKLAIFGSSGHAKDIALIHKQNEQNCEIVFIEPQNEAETIKNLNKKGFDFIIGVGDNHVRKEIAQKHSHLRWTNVISRQACVSDNQELGVGLFIGFGVYLSDNVKVDDHAIIHCNSVVGHDANIGKYVQLSPGVCIGGNGVMIEEGSYIGPNVTIINKALTVGEWSRISLASTVTGSIPPHVLYQTVHKKVILGI